MKHINNSFSLVWIYLKEMIHPGKHWFLESIGFEMDAIMTVHKSKRVMMPSGLTWSTAMPNTGQDWNQPDWLQFTHTKPIWWSTEVGKMDAKWVAYFVSNANSMVKAALLTKTQQTSCVNLECCLRSTKGINPPATSQLLFAHILFSNSPNHHELFLTSAQKL